MLFISSESISPAVPDCKGDRIQSLLLCGMEPQFVTFGLKGYPVSLRRSLRAISAATEEKKQIFWWWAAGRAWAQGKNCRWNGEKGCLNWGYIDDGCGLQAVRACSSFGERCRTRPNSTWTGVLSSRKDNCILKIHRIKAGATSVMTTMCTQKGTEKDRFIIHWAVTVQERKANNKNPKPTKTNRNTQKKHQKLARPVAGAPDDLSLLAGEAYFCASVLMCWGPKKGTFFFSCSNFHSREPRGLACPNFHVFATLEFKTSRAVSNFVSSLIFGFATISITFKPRGFPWCRSFAPACESLVRGCTVYWTTLNLLEHL